jgi:glycyl-tRNA synthetase (class II)
LYVELTNLLVLQQIDNYSGKELGELIRKFKIVNPATQNELTEPEEFNLMFGSSIGPTGQVKGSVILVDSYRRLLLQLSS